MSKRNIAKSYDALALRRTSNPDPTPTSCESRVWHFESAAPLYDFGPLRQNAFGGSSVALAIHAAYHTFDANPSAASLRLYSVLGQFLGPARATAPLHLSVTSLRDTRSFATRQVVISQAHPKDHSRRQTSCTLLIDFTVKKGKNDERTLLSLSPPPQRPVTHHSCLLDHDDFIAAEIRRRFLPKQIANIFNPFWDLLGMFKIRYPPEGILGKTAAGGRHDHVDEETRATPVHERYSYDWLQLQDTLPVSSSTDRAKPNILLPPSTTAASAALLAYFLDSWTSVIAPWAGRVDDGHVEQFASLDFALRFHVDNLDATKWHLRQSSVKAAHDERNYIESQLWCEQAERRDETQSKTNEEDLRLVVTLTQTCILRGTDRGAASKL